MGFPSRYPKQPWTYDARDLVTQGEPETTVFLPCRERLDGLHIVGLDTDVMLGVRCTEHGSPISCAVTNEIVIEHVPLQSNPRRQTDGDTGDGA